MGRVQRQRRRKQKTTSKQHSIGHVPEVVSFLRWMKKCTSHELAIQHLVLAYFDETGRGLMTRCSIHPGEILVSIPGDLLITPASIRKDVKLTATIDNSLESLTDEEILTLFLLSEHKRGPDSPVCWPYIQQLPRTYSTPPYFTDPELELLPRNARDRAKENIEKFNKSVEKLTQCCGAGYFDIETVRWAWCCVNTRCVSVKAMSSSGCGGVTCALIPYLDLLNHSPYARISASFNETTNCFEIRTLDSYAAYDQVFISYHDEYSNVDLFVEYGFTIPNNIYNTYDFTFDNLMKLADMFNNTVKDNVSGILCEQNLNRNLYCTFVGISWNLQTALRLIAMDWEELQNWKVVLFGDPVSERNETLTKKMLLSLLDAARSVNRMCEGHDVLSVHEEIALSLHKDDWTILTACINKYTNMDTLHL